MQYDNDEYLEGQQVYGLSDFVKDEAKGKIRQKAFDYGRDKLNEKLGNTNEDSIKPSTENTNNQNNRQLEKQKDNHDLQQNIDKQKNNNFETGKSNSGPKGIEHTSDRSPSVEPSQGAGNSSAASSTEPNGNGYCRGWC